jgi:hypothetical protein
MNSNHKGIKKYFEIQSSYQHLQLASRQLPAASLLKIR